MPKCWSRVSRKQVKAVRQQQSCYEKKKKWWWIWHHDYPSLHTHIYVSGFRLVFLNTFDFFKWDISHGAPYKGNTTAWCMHSSTSFTVGYENEFSLFQCKEKYCSKKAIVCSFISWLHCSWLSNLMHTKTFLYKMKLNQTEFPLFQW